MAVFETAFAHKLSIATPYMYFSDVSKQILSYKAHFTGLTFSTKCIVDAGTIRGDLPNPRDTATHIMSVWTTPITYRKSA